MSLVSVTNMRYDCGWFWGGKGWLQVVTDCYGWFLVVTVLTSGYWWLWVVMTTSDELLRSKKGEGAVSSRSLDLLNSLIHCSR